LNVFHEEEIKQHLDTILQQREEEAKNQNLDDDHHLMTPAINIMNKKHMI
jgi:hypothetical protein